jgi:hypothetical protein
MRCNELGASALARLAIRLLGSRPDFADHNAMNMHRTSFKHTAARGALAVGASWLNSGIANALFAPVFTGS